MVCVRVTDRLALPDTVDVSLCVGVRVADAVCELVADTLGVPLLVVEGVPDTLDDDDSVIVLVPDVLGVPEVLADTLGDALALGVAVPLPVGAQPTCWPRMRTEPYVGSSKNDSQLSSDESEAMATATPGRGVWAAVLSSASLHKTSKSELHTSTRTGASRVSAWKSSGRFSATFVGDVPTNAVDDAFEAIASGCAPASARKRRKVKTTPAASDVVTSAAGMDTQKNRVLKR